MSAIYCRQNVFTPATCTGERAVAEASASNEDEMRPRDLIGYGGRPPDIVWPNGARVAVSLVVNFEEGAELAIGDGDDRNERIAEVASVVEAGTRDFAQEEMFAYGMRAGLWRFLDAFERHRAKATFFMCGRAVERSPRLAAEVVARGHEPACHGWLWRPHADFLDRAEERMSLLRCIEVTQAVTGERPLGFFCRGSQSPHTRELLAAAGAKRMLVVPYSLDCNDMKFFHPNGFVEPDQFVRYIRAALSTLLDEAARGRGGVLNIGFHLRICGRPARFAAVKGILEALDQLGDRVWVARRIDLARHWRARGGPEGHSRETR
jgi:peptidoglycan/xylan/chitin deacetylase (PgdA/CDA1 family)